MTELHQRTLSTNDDVVAVCRLAGELARESGMPTGARTKLASVISGLARRSIANPGPSAVAFSVVAGVETGTRLIVAVSNVGALATGAGTAGWHPENGEVALSRELREVALLVDQLDCVVGPNGGVTVTVAAQLSAEPTVSPDLLERLGSLDRDSQSGSQATNEELTGQLEAQLVELSTVYAEVERLNKERTAVNEELALTNRGVLDLIAELSAANDSLTLSGVGFRQLADQQSALADLGHRAVASRDLGLLAQGVVGVLKRVLGISAVAVLAFDEHEARRLEVIAAAGARLDPPHSIALGREQAVNLRRAGTFLTDPSDGRGDLPSLLAAGARSRAVVAVHTPGRAWGVLVACDSAEHRFNEETTAFLEAAVSLFAFAIARMASEDVAQHAATHDGLTGLPNRTQLLKHLSSAFDRPVASTDVGVDQPQMAVIFIDIDGFKQVNDTAGHAAGDDVLVEATERLHSRTRECDILARLGGDEFVALCEGDAEMAARISERLLTAFDDPFSIAGREVFLSASAGVAMAAAGVSSEQILADADIAMYHAKQTPGSASAAFEPRMRQTAELESRLHSELRRARERGQLRAVYQPIVDLDDGTVSAVEALTRWRHPELGDVPAERTVAAAAKIGLAWEHTCWIASEAAANVSAWNKANAQHPPLRLAVNFTPLLLGDLGRIADFEECVTGAGLPFHLLDVELTETAFADPTPGVLASLGELRRLGARLAMDDFGTGYSSLVALTSLPFNVLKIDRSFVSPLDRGGDRLLLSAIALIARSRQLETIGEGIETATQLTALMAAGCDLGQGYLFAKPLERERLRDLAALESTFGDVVREARAAVLGEDSTVSVPA